MKRAVFIDSLIHWKNIEEFLYTIPLIIGNTPISEFGKLLLHAWKIKKTLSQNISSSEINDIYETAIRAGAEGGKVLGAGGGGFILFFVKPEDQKKVKNVLKSLTHVPFLFENSGSQIVVNQPNGF